MGIMGVIATLGVMMGASWCAGINLYATVAVLGLMDRYVEGFTLPGTLTVLSSNWVIWPALFLYVVEFFADKIPLVDTAWDAVHTFIRVPAGAVLAAMAVGNVPLDMQLLAGLAGGTLAFGSHATKATVRASSHATGASVVTSPTISMAEDAFVVGTLALMLAHPVFTLLATLASMAVAWFLMKWLLRVIGAIKRRFWPKQTLGTTDDDEVVEEG